MGRCAVSEIEKAQIKVLSDKGFSFSVIARDIRGLERWQATFCKTQKHMEPKNRLDIHRSWAQPPAEECYEKLQGKE